MVEYIDIGKSINELERQETLVIGNEDNEYVRKVKYEINPMTGYVEAMDFQEEPNFIFPTGSAAEGRWRSAITFNRILKVAKSAFNTYLSPVAEFFLGENVGKELMKEVSYQWFDTRIKYFVLGKPRPRKPEIPVLQAAQGAAYPGFGKKDSYNGIGTLEDSGRILDEIGSYKAADEYGYRKVA